MSRASCLRAEGHSLRAIAGALGVGQSTVRDDLKELSGSTQFEQPERVKSLDGKSRPATRLAPAPEPDDEPLFAPGEGQAIVDELEAADGPGQPR